MAQVHITMRCNLASGNKTHRFTCNKSDPKEYMPEVFKAATEVFGNVVKVVVTVKHPASIFDYGSTFTIVQSGDMQWRRATL